MQMVIDIPEKLVCEGFERLFTEEEKNILIKAIGNGTPLPKGHGRLIDADALIEHMNNRMEVLRDDESIWESSSVETAINMFAPIVIEANGGDADAGSD